MKATLTYETVELASNAASLLTHCAAHHANPSLTY
jgi:hypothetical protein